jgi:hypothetical protein
MWAAVRGHDEILAMLLAQPDIDANIINNVRFFFRIIGNRNRIYLPNIQIMLVWIVLILLNSIWSEFSVIYIFSLVSFFGFQLC